MSTRLRAVPATLLLLLSLAACGDDTADTAEPVDEPTASVPSTAPATPGTCEYLQDEEAGPAAKPVELPPVPAVPTDKVTITTNLGPIVVSLDPAAAPCTVNSFASLAKQGYYDNTKCHRLVTQGIYVLQCGDPTATGSGGPGYRYDDELSGEETYPAGTLAMANRSIASDGRGTNGSQFFIVYQDTDLPAAYTVFGKVNKAAIKLVTGVAEKGNGPDGIAPAQEVLIQSVK